MLALVGTSAGDGDGTRGSIALTRRLPMLWRYRELLRNLVVRDLALRYRNSAIGFAWSLLNPLLMMLVFTVVFSGMLRAAPADVPYPPFLLTGLLAWNFFQISVVAGVSSIVGNADLVTKVYFPREVLPISAMLVNCVNYLLALLVLVSVLLLFGIMPDPLWAMFPIILISQALFTLGVTFVVASLNVFYRDTSYIVDVLLLAWFFLTPVFYDTRQVTVATNGSELASIVLAANPMAAYVTGYRAIFLRHTAPDAVTLLTYALVGLLVCLVGYAIFARSARSFGDIL